MAEIITENLEHRYGAGTPFEHVAIRNVSLRFAPGEMVFLAGHTGSGKSTFIQHLNALLAPTAGRVLLDGEDINRSKASRRDTRRKVGLVFQYPEYQLFEETVRKDIAFGPRNMGLSEAEIDERVSEAADFAGVGEEQFDRSPLELSGGQKRRIAIAGVMAMRPSVLILDEPTAGLDPRGSRLLMENLRTYREKTGATLLIVSHSMEDAARYAGRIVVFREGEVCLDGTPAEVFAHPETVYEAGLVLPKTAEIARLLKQQGIPVDNPAYTRELLLEAICRAAGLQA
ncbi:MAG: energy-coupling factor transporter ATPase [Oscillospiraceae bacterium]|nr:energy-coupling factor transporter ATPase [Oscillospiraceae bacterium]